MEATELPERSRKSPVLKLLKRTSSGGDAFLLRIQAVDDRAGARCGDATKAPPLEAEGRLGTMNHDTRELHAEAGLTVRGPSPNGRSSASSGLATFSWSQTEKVAYEVEAEADGVSEDPCSCHQKPFPLAR
jgi:hypothetical protein